MGTPPMSGTQLVQSDRLNAYVSVLTNWARQESPSGSAEGVNAMASLVHHFITESKLRPERIPLPGFGDMLVLRGGPRNGRKAALILGHLDTVHPVGTVNGKFQIRREGDRLYGPGIYDMKAGILIALEALQDLLGKAELSRPVIFALSPDEEVGSPASRPITEQLAQEAAYALVLEPAREGGGCVTCRKGVGRFEISVEGVAAHAGVRHEDGRNAIAEAAHQILKVESLTHYETGVTANVGLISGGTSVNTVPQHCKFTVDFRAPTDALCRSVSQAIGALSPSLPGTRLKIHGGLVRPPYERTQGNIELYQQAQTIADALGLPFREAARTGGGSDGNFTAALGIPTLDGLGADGAGAHTLNEYADLSTFDRRIALIRTLLKL